MDWVLIACCAVMAWVALLVVAGERKRLEQEETVKRLTESRQKEAASPAEPPVLSVPKH